MARQSPFRAKKLFDQHNWLVTIFNAGPALSGHAALFIEGENANGTLVLYRCEIFARPFKDYLRWYMDQSGGVSLFADFYQKHQAQVDRIANEVVCYVILKPYTAYPPKNFSSYTSHTWSVNKTSAESLLDSVGQEKSSVDQVTKAAIGVLQAQKTPSLERFILFKQYGHASTLAPSAGQSAEGINCVNWCEKHLPKAGITPTSIIWDSLFASPESHAAQANFSMS